MVQDKDWIEMHRQDRGLPTTITQGQIDAVTKAREDEFWTKFISEPGRIRRYVELLEEKVNESSEEVAAANQKPPTGINIRKVTETTNAASKLHIVVKIGKSKGRTTDPVQSDRVDAEVAPTHTKTSILTELCAAVSEPYSLLTSSNTANQPSVIEESLHMIEAEPIYIRGEEHRGKPVICHRNVPSIDFFQGGVKDI